MNIWQEFMYFGSLYQIVFRKTENVSWRVFFHSMYYVVCVICNSARIFIDAAVYNFYFASICMSSVFVGIFYHQSLYAQMQKKTVVTKGNNRKWGKGNFLWQWKRLHIIYPNITHDAWNNCSTTRRKCYWKWNQPRSSCLTILSMSNIRLTFSPFQRLSTFHMFFNKIPICTFGSLDKTLAYLEVWIES